MMSFGGKKVIMWLILLQINWKMNAGFISPQSPRILIYMVCLRLLCNHRHTWAWQVEV